MKVVTVEQMRAIERRSADAGVPWQQLMDLCQQIDGFPRHLGMHNGGMIITGPPLV